MSEPAADDAEPVTDSRSAAGGVDTVYLHVGTMKSGTTYLQSRFLQHRRALEAVGVRYPKHQLSAMREYLGRSGTLTRRDVSGAWGALLANLRADGAHTAVLSMEFLSASRSSRFAALIAELKPADVHVVVTVRDLARVMPAQWQETIQNQAVWTWEEYAQAITTQSREESDLAAKFWRQHDIARIVADWSAEVGTDHMHLVTVPPPGASQDVLWNRFLAVLGIDGAQFPAPDGVRRSNTGVDAASAEFLRRLNARADLSISHTAYLRYVKHLLGKQLLVGRENAVKPSLTAEQRAWVESFSDQLVERLRATGIAVSGDLDDLRPTAAPEPGSAPAAPPEAAIADVATDVVLALLKQLDERESEVDEPPTTPRRRGGRRSKGRAAAPVALTGEEDAEGDAREVDGGGRRSRKRARRRARRAASRPSEDASGSTQDL